MMAARYCSWSREVRIMSVVFGFLLCAILQISAVHAKLKVGFYDKKCPQVESIVKGVVAGAVTTNKGTGAGLLRVHFHDCFVRGCDASVLLDSTPGNAAEKDAGPNKGSLRGYETIDSAKSKVEAVCPGIVSCADIVAFAARDSIVQLGGPSYSVQAGRRDGTISRDSEANANLPSFTSNVAQLTKNFAAKKLSIDEMITLSGAHTIGQARCSSFNNRLYTYNSTTPQDPSLNTQLALTLKMTCPQSSSNANFVQDLDVSSGNTFDNGYYKSLASGKGILSSDQVLYQDPTTRPTVQFNAQQESKWISKFTKAMVKMGTIEVLTGSQGEIRRSCRVVNVASSS